MIAVEGQKVKESEAAWNIFHIRTMTVVLPMNTGSENGFIDMGRHGLRRADTIILHETKETLFSLQRVQAIRIIRFIRAYHCLRCREQLVLRNNRPPAFLAGTDSLYYRRRACLLPGNGHLR